MIKKLLRLAVYRNERKKLVREIGIRRTQDLLLRSVFPRNAKRLVVFLIPGSDWATGRDSISGGVMSIVSLSEETSAILQQPTLLCTMNGEHLLLKHTMFQNHSTVYRFSQLPWFFREAEEILIHLPELLADRFISHLSPKEKSWLGGMKRRHINIMNQNIRLMPGKESIESLRKFATELTITTAHQQYCSPYFRNLFQVPIHKFSVWISPGRYQFKEWGQKENLLVVSPDEREEKAAILEKLSKISGLEIRIIRDLRYEQYKELIAKAKWSLTFGEGLDGYFIEPVFSGAIAFAVYNEAFFTQDFKILPTVFSSYQELEARIVGEIAGLDNAVDFPVCQQALFDTCAQHYSYSQYQENIAAFYKKAYTYA